MPKFAEILTKSAESIERPPLPPKGTYEFVITAQAKTRDIESDKFHGEAVEFPVRGVNAMEDVDSAELKAYGAPKNIVTRHSFMFNGTDENEFQRSEFALKEFLVTHLGQDPKLSMKELMNGAVNKHFLAYVDYRPDGRNPDNLFVNISKTAPMS
jgi:hypothetical protein